MTKTNEERVHEWYLIHASQEELDDKVKATLDYVKRFNEPEDDVWVVWAQEIISGAHGQFTVRIFLDEVLGHTDDSFMHMKDTKDLDVVMEAFDGVSRELAKQYNLYTTLRGEYTIGHNEADGSLGVFYSERA